MNDVKIEKNDNTEMIELSQEDKIKMLTPTEEYQKGVRKRRGKTFLFIIFLLIEMLLGFLVFCGVIGEDLHYRVKNQIDNNVDGKNEFVTGTYSGETDFGYFIGEGTFDFSSGTVYTGNWKDNKMNGLGELNIPSEGNYIGEFLNSEKSGQGKFTWDDGAVYDGEWKNDQMNGQGSYISPDNVKYTGTFNDNKFQEGECEFSNDTGDYVLNYKEFNIDNVKVVFKDGTQYSGDTDGTTLNGTGSIKFANGDQYVGEHESGSRTGQGVYTWNNGDSYDGTWENDVMFGNGKYTYADGSCADGKFEDNQFIEGTYRVVNSFGEYSFKIENKKAISVIMKLKSGTEYSGDMEDEKLTGTAQISYSNGDKYSGRVVDGYKSGQGSYVWRSGASYEGEWKKDKMDGQGTYFYPEKETGYKLIGEFKKGVPNGECQYYKTSSESYETDWKNGKCVKIYE